MITLLKRIIISVVFTVTVHTGVFAQSTVTYDDNRMAALKEAYLNRDQRVLPYINSIIESAEKYFIDRPFNIVSNKKHIAPSKDPRDYVSLSRYWWPNPDAKDGLPYIRFDGKSNPELEEYDYRKITELEGVVSNLGLLYYFTGTERYAKRAAGILREWFLDPVTGMNPNMIYAQSVPGMMTLRGTGILDARSIVYAMNGAKLIEGSKYWSNNDKIALQEWIKAFLYWMQNSTQGQMEFKAANNHGLWYDVTRMAMCCYLDDYTSMKSIISTSLLPRLDQQQERDGSFPQELVRTLGLSYTTFVLDALYEASDIAAKAGLDLWSITTEKGSSIAKGVEFAFQYYINPGRWPFQQISAFETGRGSMALYIAGMKLNKKEYVEAARKIGYQPKTNLKYLLNFDIIEKK